MIRRLLPLISLTLALAVPAHALASGYQATGMADDATLGGDYTKASAAAQAWATMGVDTARVIVRWDAIAPGLRSKSKPSGFDPSDPNSPGYAWQKVDQEVGLLTAVGIKPILAVSGPGPLWSSSKPSLKNERYKPRASLFGQFASAVAKRYGDRVEQYIIWNEPNLVEYLQPQFDCKGKVCTPDSPNQYRELYRSGAAAIKAADPGAVTYAGALAPRGDDPTARNAKMRPLQFIRALACVTSSYKRDRTGACRTARPITADAFSYHPHAVLSSPTSHSFQKDDASIGDLPRLESALDRATKRGILKPVTGARFNLELTEFGYQTNPPDAYSGVSTLRQEEWVQESTYIAYRDPRVQNITQYEYVDEPIKGNSAGTDPFSSWQSGLYFSSGVAKPLLQAFPNPFWATKVRGGKATFWGQVRPGGANTVTIQHLVDGTWVDDGTATTNGIGMFQISLPVPKQADYRYTYTPPEGADPTFASGVSVPQNVRP